MENQYQILKNAGDYVAKGIEMRAYDEGVAFRYRVDDRKRGKATRISAEHTQVRFPAGSIAYAQYAYEEPYFRSPVYAIEERCRYPLTVELPNGEFAVLAEADNGAANVSRLADAGERVTMMPG